jgi:hypothetical protein
MAVENGNREIVELLVDSAADVNARSNNGWTPLFYAVCYGRKDAAELLIARKADANVATADGMTPIARAAVREDWAMVRLLADGGASVNVREKAGCSPLLLAAASNQGRSEEVVAAAKTLLARNADVNAKAANGKTPLIWASHRGNREIVELLADNGADLDVVDDGGFTALDYAVVYNFREIQESLRRRGAKK